MLLDLLSQAHGGFDSGRNKWRLICLGVGRDVCAISVEGVDGSPKQASAQPASCAYGNCASPRPTVYFVTPDFSEPSGGIRVMYRHTDILNSAGNKAFVLHQRRGIPLHMVRQSDLRDRCDQCNGPGSWRYPR